MMQFAVLQRRREELMMLMREVVACRSSWHGWAVHEMLVAQAWSKIGRSRPRPRLVRSYIWFRNTPHTSEFSDTANSIEISEPSVRLDSLTIL